MQVSTQWQHVVRVLSAHQWFILHRKWCSYTR